MGDELQHAFGHASCLLQNMPARTQTPGRTSDLSESSYSVTLSNNSQ
ncbi:hypothetical protein NBRC3293_1930 [Gluconobacter oxydans NBRC 3293]|uniref:Uncharacterized protein n=1 Tax=Gluconobacter oxydans NBRC 3293 TaxID=1315969 RepID=A0A829X352_GLUOY|nr:hypothetical protein NBRC3293_1930 [Gluconobacter oxydans NBRC 3293]